MVKTKYPCTQKDLYPTSRLGVKKLITIAEPLKKLKGKYSDTFFSDFMSEIDDACNACTVVGQTFSVIYFRHKI